MEQTPMKKRTWFLLVIAVFAALLAGGVLKLAGLASHLSGLVYRPLVSYQNDLASGGERILSLDAQNGVSTTLATLNLEWAGADQFTVDVGGKTAYLGGRAPGESTWRLYRINLSSGAVISSTLLDPGLGGFGFTTSGPGRLVAYDYVELTNPSRRVGRIVSLDPVSGGKKSIAELNLEWFGMGTLTVDVPAQVAYLCGRKAGETSWRLFAVDLHNGIVNDAVVLDTGEGGFGLAAYPPGKLLAYLYKAGQGQIVLLDPMTGSTTTKAVFDMQFSGTGQFVADSFNNVAYLGARLQGESDWRMYIFDLETGRVSNNTILKTGEGGFGFSAFLQAWSLFAPLINK
jgi:hypothetical protein